MCSSDLKFDPLPQAPAVDVIDLDEELGVVGGELGDVTDEVVTDD